MIITLIVLALSAVFFVIGKTRSDIVALCALLVLIGAGVLTPQEGLAGFSSQVVIMMAGLFIVGGAVLQTGLAKKISSQVMKMGGSNESLLFLLVILVTTVIGAFVSNTGTVALMLPIVVSLAAGAKLEASRFLMPLAFASSMGGMLTLIGTPPNLIIQETLTGAGYEPLGFFSFTPVGLVTIVVGIVVLFPLSKWLLSKDGDEGQGTRKGKSLRQLVKEYRLDENLSRLVVTDRSGMVGRTISQLDIHRVYGITVMEVRRETTGKGPLLKNVSQTLASPDMMIQAGDIIYVTGTDAQVAQMRADYGLTLSEKDHSMDFYDIGIAEVVLLSTSRFVGKRVKETGFRAKFGLNIIGIRRDNEYIMENLTEQKLHTGDVLLVQGSWQNVGNLTSDEDHWVVLGRPLKQASEVTLDYKAPLAGCIMLLMVAMMVFDFIPVAPVTAVLIASVLMILTGCFKSVEAAYKTINWESIILIAAMMPMSTALEKTGASELISHSLVSALGAMSPVALLAGVYFTTSLLTMFISNTACAVLMAPIAMSSAVEMGVSPYPYLFAVTVAASMCFASPFSTPPNALVMKAGRYTFMDYVKVGLPLQLIMGVVMIVALPLLFPF